MPRLEARLLSRAARWSLLAAIIAAVLAGASVVRFAAPAQAASATSLSSGTGFSCAVTQDHAAVCWGLDTLGQLGTGSDTAPEICGGGGSTEYECSRVPVQVAGLTSGVEKVDAGEEHACALLTGGGVKCWGRNDFGQLGSGDVGPETCATPSFPRMCSNTPVDVFGLSSGVEDIDAGGNHTCALMTGGGMKCWGANDLGQLGATSTGDCGIECSTKPIDVTGLTSGVQDISVGHGHTCAITDAGAAMCWGWNSRGQLGDGTQDDSAVPVQVAGLTSGVTQIAADFVHSCALVSGGTKCWGDNRDGQLAKANHDNSTCTPQGTDDCFSTTPINVSASGTMLATGESYTCVGGGAGIKCWGKNYAGALGNGITGPDTCKSGVMCSISPVSVVGLAGNVIALAPGGGHNCALLEGGGVQCWGGNGYGDTGNGTDGNNEYTPVYAVGLTGSAPSPTPTRTPHQQTEEWGDNNCDGSISPPDVTRALAKAASPDEVTPIDGCPNVGDELTLINFQPQDAGATGGFTFIWGDVHCNNALDGRDGLSILWNIAGLGKLPVDGDCPTVGDLVTFE
jgi:alpha-tubulin suppressor-like RCC1 family protein